MIKSLAARACVLALLTTSVGCDGAGETPAAGGAVDSSVDVTYVEWGNYVIHFNAFTTDQLAADVAREYDIVRSKSRAMLNVTVLAKQPDGTTRPVRAKLNVQVTNLAAQVKDLTMREIVEGDNEAIYYVGDTPVAKGETLIFNIEVTPEGETQAHRLKFQRHFNY
jgi:hypothetical protein